MVGLPVAGSRAIPWVRHLRGRRDVPGEVIENQAVGSQYGLDAGQHCRPVDRGGPERGGIPCLHPAGRVEGALDAVRPDGCYPDVGRAIHPGLAGHAKVPVIRER
jgi:hypothetical protein